MLTRQTSTQRTRSRTQRARSQSGASLGFGPFSAALCALRALCVPITLGARPAPPSILLALIIAVPAAAQTTIALKPSASAITAGTTIALGEIADIAGPDAAAMSAVAVPAPAADARSGWAVIPVSAVRQALDAAGVNWGRVTLRGTSCQVRTGESALPPPAPTQPRPAAAQPNGPRPRLTFAQVDTSVDTIRAAIAGRLAAMYGVEPARLRIAFESPDDRLLDSIVGNRRLDLDCGAVVTSPKVPFSIAVYDADRVVLTRVVTVQAQVRRPVVSAAAVITKGQTITEDLVQVDEQWVAPGDRAASSLGDVVGTVASSRIAAGETVDPGDFAAPLLVKRGDMLYVHVLSGPITIKVKARALGQARDGEMVQCKLEGYEGTFSARVSGRGRAVMIVDDSGIKPLAAGAASDEPARPSASAPHTPPRPSASSRSTRPPTAGRKDPSR